jgi:predicted membrane chloride channel (bestrophin family)
MLSLEIIDDHYDGTYNIEISSQGHTFLTLVVPFLLVSRVNIGLNRYNQARDCLGVMYRESRELIQSCCVFSNHTTDQVAKEWRNQVAYRTLLLLRLSMAVIDYPRPIFQPGMFRNYVAPN